jgi:hypothetical protein
MKREEGLTNTNIIFDPRRFSSIINNINKAEENPLFSESNLETILSDNAEVIKKEDYPIFIFLMEQLYLLHKPSEMEKEFYYKRGINLFKSNKYFFNLSQIMSMPIEDITDILREDFIDDPDIERNNVAYNLQEKVQSCLELLKNPLTFISLLGKVDEFRKILIDYLGLELSDSLINSYVRHGLVEINNRDLLPRINPNDLNILISTRAIQLKLGGYPKKELIPQIKYEISRFCNENDVNLLKLEKSFDKISAVCVKQDPLECKVTNCPVDNLCEVVPTLYTDPNYIYLKSIEPKQRVLFTP